MIDKLKEYYGIKVDYYQKKEEGILFFIVDQCYYFCSTLYDDETVKESLQIIQSYSSIPFHSIIINKNGKYIEDGFILFKLNTFVDDITINDIYLYDVRCDQKGFQMNLFWEEKLDYFDNHISELFQNEEIRDSYDYFLGIGEMLLSIIRFEEYYYDVRLSHKKIRSLSTLSFYNPLNVSFDSVVKDLAGYIRLTKDYDLLSKIYESVPGYLRNYFYVRLCFPYLYFDGLLSYLNDENSNIVTNFLLNINEYQEYINNIQRIFGIYIIPIKKCN